VTFTTALVRAAGIVVFAGSVALGVQVIRTNSAHLPYRHEAWIFALAVAGMMAGIALETAYHALRRREDR
jgi:general stress protein CsbA